MALIDHNVTVDPRASATPVDDPAISEIIDLVSGEVLDTRAFVSSRRYDDLIACRHRSRADQSRPPFFGAFHALSTAEQKQASVAE
jgi:hypothetical protein